jgi:transcriptional regulator with AAA-type ATPase domain
MRFLTADQRSQLAAIARLTWCNPFTADRVALERQVLGPQFIDAPEAWNREEVRRRDRTNLDEIARRVDPLAQALRQRLLDGVAAADDELLLYEDLICFLLYHRYRGEFTRAILEAAERGAPLRRLQFADRFESDAHHFLRLAGRTLPSGFDAAHLYACCFQIRRAFVHIFNHIAGESARAAALRAAVWQSIFTHDLGRYVRGRYKRMGDIPTLITGPSGTGKELVARAIGMARYIPFDATRREFTEDFAASFYPLDVSALPATLVESELFGHKRGSFTGAVSDRIGWFEACPPLGTVFLDEIGEVVPAIQVKLLRVLQTRTFHRLGEIQTRHFRGKIIAATNRDLAAAMRAGRFREDFYYRLCADVITTPSLRQQLDESPQVLRGLVLFITRRLAREEAEALAEEVCQWIESRLGRDYPWPGNIRELEQCVRSVWLRHEYRPPAAAPAGADDAREALAAAVRDGRLSAADLDRHYYTLVFHESGSYEEAARRLGVNWRTVKAKVDSGFLEQLGAPHLKPL